MIGYLQGEILDLSDGKALIGVGSRQTPQSGGMVGYSVSIPNSAANGALLIGQIIELFIHTHVREDAFDLYGFTSRFEKELFLTLLSVNGIGPRSALGILSGVEPESLIHAIIEGDRAFLTQVPGIGKKTAERVVIELQDSVRKKVETGSLKNVALSRKSSSIPLSSASGGAVSESALIRDAKAALMSLGYREAEVQQLIRQAMDRDSVRPQKVEDLIKSALRQLV
jgi:Holliday junction DNA helicase RuvA